MPFTSLAFLLASLSIIGLPPFAGLWSKWYLALGALKADEIVLVGVLMVSSLLNIAYLLPIPIRAFFGKPPDDAHGGQHGAHSDAGAGRLQEAPWPCLVAITVTTLGCIFLFFRPELLYRLLLPIVTP